MTRAEFVKAMHATIEVFDRFWRVGREIDSNPENWPDDLGAADWMEQFTAHMELKGLEEK